MINKYLFYLCFSLVFGNALPLKVGETLLYNASFRSIRAASASLKTIKKEVIGIDSVYHIRFRAKSKGPINYIFPIDDEINLWIDIKTFLPIKIHEKISEGKFKRSTTVHFNRTSNFALINNDTAPTIASEMTKSLHLSNHHNHYQNHQLFPQHLG